MWFKVLSQPGCAANCDSVWSFRLVRGLAKLRPCRCHAGSFTQHSALGPSRQPRGTLIPIMKRTVSHRGRLATVLKATLLQMTIPGFQARKSGSDHEDWPCGRHIFSGIQGCKFLDRKIND